MAPGCFSTDEYRRAGWPSAYTACTTVATNLANSAPAHYCAGRQRGNAAARLVQWLRDNSRIHCNNRHDVETLGKNCADNGDVYFVPASAGYIAALLERVRRAE